MPRPPSERWRNKTSPHGGKKKLKNNKPKGRRQRRLEIINGNRQQQQQKYSAFSSNCSFSPNSVCCAELASQNSQLLETPQNLMNYLSPLRSILQCAVSEESKPQQGRQGRKRLATPSSDRWVRRLACHISPTFLPSCGCSHIPFPSSSPSPSLSPCGACASSSPAPTSHF